MTYDSLLVDLRRYLERGFTEASDQIVYQQLPRLVTTGTPAYYADYDYQHWLITPTPATAKTLEILYYEQPRFLGDDFQTNWVTEYIPDLLLYAALLEATPFLKNDERIQTWQAMYDRAAQAVNGEDLKRILDRSANRSEA